MKKVCISIMCGILLVIGVYAVTSRPTTETSLTVYKTNKVMLGNIEYTLEVVDTDFFRERGLSYRTSLAPQVGMLFIFDTPRISRFWMKDMNFPIDVIWLDQDKKVVHIEHSLSPSTYPESFGPKTLTQYVIELNAGDTEKNGLLVGEVVNF